MILPFVTAVESLYAADVPDSKWRLDLNYRLGFNVEAAFMNAGASATPNNPSVTGRSYSDGFVGTDSAGNAQGVTTFWGYERSEQVAGDHLTLRNSNGGSFGEDDPLAHGIEFSIARRLGHHRRIDWGIESGFGYSRLDAKWSGAVNPGTLSLDAFSLGGIIPPMPPYAGPQTVEPLSPFLEVVSTTVPLSLSADLDATIYAFRFGPYFEFLLGRHFSASVGGGLSLAAVDTSVSFRENAPAPYSSASRSMAGGDSDVLIGGYANAVLTAKMTEGTHIFTGVQFHALGDSDHAVGDKKVRLDMGGIVNWVIGISFRF